MCLGITIIPGQTTTPVTSVYVLDAVSSMFKASIKGNAYIEVKVYRASVTEEKGPELAVTRKNTPGFISLIPDKNVSCSSSYSDCRYVSLCLILEALKKTLFI